MPMTRLIYVSVLTEDCDMDALQNILAVSRANNAVNGISGILCYDPAFFLQCLEGPPESVHTLYRAIERDPRHANVKVIEDAETDTRLFGDWKMAFVKASELDRQIVEKHSPQGKFDPYAFDADGARLFLVDIAASKRLQLNAQGQR